MFADGAGAQAVMATLPLTEGYATNFRNFDVEKQKVKLMQLKVVGMEAVTVPAGTFPAYKLEVTSTEGDGERATVWVAKDGRRVLKVLAVLPQLGGATLTQELKE